MTIGIDSSGDLWFIDIIRDKLTLDGRAKLVSDILIRHGIHIVHYESVGFQSSDSKSIKEMGQQKDWYISVVEVKASRQSKEDRIRGLQYYFEQGKVHWPKKYKYFSKYHNREFDMVDVFKRELWMFPSCEKDDLADCASFILRTHMIKSSAQAPAPKPVDAFAWWQNLVKESKGKQPTTFTGRGKGFYEIPSKKSCP
jgi:phage terminase large subunit-like protein